MRKIDGPQPQCGVSSRRQAGMAQRPRDLDYLIYVDCIYVKKYPPSERHSRTFREINHSNGRGGFQTHSYKNLARVESGETRYIKCTIPK